MASICAAVRIGCAVRRLTHCGTIAMRSLAARHWLMRARVGVCRASRIASSCVALVRRVCSFISSVLFGASLDLYKLTPGALLVKRSGNLQPFADNDKPGQGRSWPGLSRGNLLGAAQ